MFTFLSSSLTLFVASLCILLRVPFVSLLNAIWLFFFIYLVGYVWVCCLASWGIQGALILGCIRNQSEDAGRLNFGKYTNDIKRNRCQAVAKNEKPKRKMENFKIGFCCCAVQAAAVKRGDKA